MRWLGCAVTMLCRSRGKASSLLAARLRHEFERSVRLQQRLRVLRVGVIVESAPRLPSVPARQYHALEQRGRRESPLLEFIEHDIRDVVRGVEADEVQQREGPHRITASQLHGII